MLTITDFINILRHHYRSPIVGMDELENQTIQEWRDFEKQVVSIQSTLIQIGPEERSVQCMTFDAMVQCCVHKALIGHDLPHIKFLWCMPFLRTTAPRDTLNTPRMSSLAVSSEQYNPALNTHHLRVYYVQCTHNDYVHPHQLLYLCKRPAIYVHLLYFSTHTVCMKVSGCW